MTVRTLLIDDDPDTRAIVALALDLHPDFAVAAVSRLDAADTLRRGVDAFDLILLDMKTSDMSAGALVGTVRQWSSSAAIPVLILSPKHSDAERSYRSAGAQGVIAKPFDPVALPDRVLDMLEPFGAPARRSAG
ncbi:response regulator [Sphingomonas panacisoli]|uniref:Response regulator n=1 Tax=Sphingomonas panacisoli TaxID=1813879 RepID=A0A5B8LEJ4_9SPHN|nr:response regulator [Sphingomonas panacisoli]QDZ06366.1 response regulator [Sphingomonas panacisoli]